ncbi:MAG: hypothetical protein VKL39_10860 [Leptolyngbyaceae bacterium]|nr:hypothetical protein [Leptolyngbyaceae bacterium]
MVHTYEVFVDFKEYSSEESHTGSMRYEIHAESRSLADTTARSQARTDHPSASEYDIRTIRLLR